MKIGKVISTSIEGGVRFIKFEGSGTQDIKDRQFVSPHGIDSVPIVGAVCLYVETSIQGELVVIGYIGDNGISGLSEGESRLYSTNSSGVLQIDLIMRDDGTAEFGGSADFMVRFLELKAGYDELKADLNSHISDYNTHIHITTATIGASATPGVISPTTSTSTPSTASIDDAKIDEIKTSG